MVWISARSDSSSAGEVGEVSTALDDELLAVGVEALGPLMLAGADGFGGATGTAAVKGSILGRKDELMSPIPTKKSSGERLEQMLKSKGKTYKG